MSRIPELPSDMDAFGKQIYDKIAAGPRGRVRGPLALWLYSPRLAERAQGLGEYLRFDCCWEQRLRELVILLVAKHHDCAFEWHVHEPIALKAGISAADVTAIKQGTVPKHLREDENAVYRFTIAMLTSNRVSDKEFQGVLALNGEQGIVDLASLIGYYVMGGHLLNAVELAPPGKSLNVSDL